MPSEYKPSWYKPPNIRPKSVLKNVYKSRDYIRSITVSCQFKWGLSLSIKIASIDHDICYWILNSLGFLWRWGAFSRPKFYAFFIVDGSWSDWGAWSNCDKICGGGTMRRFKMCNNPAPQNGGANCVGMGKESQSCNPQACAGKCLEKF